MAEIGHNGGPSIERGAGFRKVAWGKARTALMPTLPLEVVRLRVKRAERLGLPYKAYATIRAVSGRDIVGFLFSDNGLDMGRGGSVPAHVVDRLQGLEGAAARLGAIHLPRDPAAIAAMAGLEAAIRAPDLMTPWRGMRDTLLGLARDAAVPPDGLVVVAAHALEREWCGAADLAGIIPREVFFGR